MPDPWVLPRLGATRAAPVVTGWPARGFARTVAETAYDESDLQQGRALARSGRLGAVMVLAGMASVAGPATAGEQVLAQVRIAPVKQWDVVVAEAAREAGFLADLEAGRLSADLAEHLEEAGVGLLPDTDEIETACTCTAWAQPCRHALALLTQLGWHLDADPYVLFLLRGRTREWFVEEVTTMSRAAAYARRLLREAGSE